MGLSHHTEAWRPLSLCVVRVLGGKPGGKRPLLSRARPLLPIGRAIPAGPRGTVSCSCFSPQPALAWPQLPPAAPKLGCHCLAAVSQAAPEPGQVSGRGHTAQGQGKPSPGWAAGGEGSRSAASPGGCVWPWLPGGARPLRPLLPSTSRHPCARGLVASLWEDHLGPDPTLLGLPSALGQGPGCWCCPQVQGRSQPGRPGASVCRCRISEPRGM